MASFQKPPTVSDDFRAQDIYREAAQIIFAKGFDATSMGDIAEAVDLTKGGLYYYIKGKKALLFAIMNFAMDLVEREVVAPAKDIADPRQRLELLISGHMQLVLEEASAMAILVSEEEGLDDAHRAKILARKRDYTVVVRGTIERLLSEHPQATVVDPVIATNSLFGMMQFVVRWYRPDGRLGKKQIIEQMTQLAMHGLIPQQAA